MNTTCYIGLGSNLGNSEAYLEMAIHALDSSADIDLISVSRFYGSTPHGPKNQPDYVNAVAKLKTPLSADALLTLLQDIENANDRKRNGEIWTARTLDLDILLYGNHVIDTDHLKIPHPMMQGRAFVLYPLYELEPELLFPDGKKIREMIAQVPAEGLWLLETE
jgi:2-amino-4-hydroxy-6-hydroxymethyldihydropteridine diphosphokinase